MAKKPFLSLVWDQWKKVPPVAVADLQGKTVVVLGANAGIGFEAAKHFAKMNPGRIILACRSQARGQEALQCLKSETGYEKAELWIVDLAEFSSVKAFADKFEKDGGRLDVLVENAGMAPPFDNTAEFTIDGWEQVNNLGPSLLAFLLLPRMLQTAKKYATTPRLIIVTSGSSLNSTLEDALINSDKPLRTFGSKEYCTKSVMGSRRYYDTKLLNVLFTRALSDRLQTNSLIVNTVNPGFCYSELRRNMPSGIAAAGIWLMERAMARTAEEGSRQLVWAAVGGDDQLDDLRGAFINNLEVCEAGDFIISDKGKSVQEKLWLDLVDELSAIDSRVRGIVDTYLK
ncbi:short-chain dehydrogenase [Crucibulum laeve]|uniref:Short-chain dehydrogenase n=1 Tax=Crucibulum laeve TaxID=68775 RepID=A0A5C3M258_9AGAR|nr:short-chain dehydrogenase [Crucibulum laeve]